MREAYCYYKTLQAHLCLRLAYWGMVSMDERNAQMPAELEGLLEMVREHHCRLHEWAGREPLTTTRGQGARCVGARCHLEPHMYERLKDYLATRGLEVHCCPEATLPQAQQEGWELLHLREGFWELEFVFQQQTLMCRERM